MTRAGALLLLLIAGCRRAPAGVDASTPDVPDVVVRDVVGMDAPDLSAPDVVEVDLPAAQAPATAPGRSPFDAPIAEAWPVAARWTPREEEDYAGCCWVMQWMPPPLAKICLASTKTISRPG